MQFFCVCVPIIDSHLSIWKVSVLWSVCLTTHQTGTGTFLRQNARDTKKYELKDKNINIWLGSQSFSNNAFKHLISLFMFFLFFFTFAFFNHVFLKEITLELKMGSQKWLAICPIAKLHGEKKIVELTWKNIAQKFQ